MKKIIFLFSVFIFKVGFAQILPNFDNGIQVSYNVSNRHIPTASKQTPLYSANIGYQFHVNYKKVSFKTGVSSFITGHHFSYIYSADRGLNAFSRNINTQSIYVYVRVPLVFSVNIKRFYIDLGASPCIRVYNNSDSYLSRGNGIDKPGATYILEGHVGYYIPIKQRRLFIEGGIYISEIGNAIFLPNGNYRNNYTNNFQIGIGLMLNRKKIL